MAAMLTILLRAVAIATVLLTTCARDVEGQTTTFGGQVRPRWENRTGTEPFVSMRTRAQLLHRSDWGGALVQIQDVRLWGEETSTTGDFSADALDVHQVWLAIGSDSTWLRAGRQEISFGDERLVGAVGWLQQGRAFDGAHLRVPIAGVTLDLVGAQLAEFAAATNAPDRELAAAHATWTRGSVRVEGYALADGHDDWRWTGGSRLLATVAGFDWGAEATLQRGATSQSDARAWMIGASVARTVGPLRLTFWYDVLSGDDDPLDGTTRVFDTLFATNHRYYGYADVFTDIPVHTGGRGLQDAAVIANAALGQSALEVAAHRFDASADGGLESSRFGEEVDLTLGHPLGDGLRLIAGASWVGVGPALEAVRGFDDDRWFGYLMIDALF